MQVPQQTMDHTSSFDNINETTIFIPYQEPEKNGESSKAQTITIPTPPDLRASDIPDGGRLRLEVFHDAWVKCFNRMQEVLQNLNAKVVENLVDAVKDAYRIPQLQMLPRVEMPTLIISGNDRTANITLLDELRQELCLEGDESSEPEGNDMATRLAYVVSLNAGECPNLTSAMKALISGFVDIPPNGIEPQPQRKASASLAPNDINLLVAWYEAVVHYSGVEEVDCPRLVVILHDFELFDASVVQDMLYICSQQVPRLPLVFILAVSSPSYPSYLQVTYPRTTLALLQIKRFTLRGGIYSMENLLTRTFFDLEFEPDIMLGPATLQFVVDQFQRYDSSVDSVISLMQLIHLRHFGNPLTLLVNDENIGERSAAEAARAFDNPLHTAFWKLMVKRITRPASQKSTKNGTNETFSEGWSITDMNSILKAVETARRSNRAQARKRRVGLAIFRLVRRFLVHQGYKTAEGKDTSSVFDLMVASLKGTIATKDAKYLIMIVKRLDADKLADLMVEMQKFFNSAPARVQDEEQMMRVKVIGLASRLSRCDSGAKEEILRIGSEFGESLAEYFHDSMSEYTRYPLWDIWHTGQVYTLAELVNPSTHAAIITGLIHPDRYLGCERRSPTDTSEDVEDQHIAIPDTSILFQRYLESGKMINIYDWYDSFALALDAERESIEARARNKKDKGKGKGRPTRIAKRRGKGKTNMQEAGSDDDDENGDEDERWKREVQARFIRALHELDFMGLIKHTGRKADHVLKTVYDLPD